MGDLHTMRQNYKKDFLLEGKVKADPIAQFEEWFEAAKKSDILEANAMILSSSSVDGIPSARTVLLKEITPTGFIFYTNYNSQKAKELEANPYASLLFLWKEMERQVRVNGKAYRVPREKSISYFKSRPKGSQLGAWVSSQSQVIKDRSVLESKKKELEKQFADLDSIPCPEHWGGYIVVPERMEFWQGRPNRLHDRLCYLTSKNESWEITRLAP